MSRGQGHVFRPTYRDRRTGQVKAQSIWWIKYGIAGKTYRESSRSTYKRDAVNLLNQRLAERGRGISRRDLEKVLYDHLEELIRNDYRRKAKNLTDEQKGRHKLVTLEGRLVRLKARFGDWHVLDIGEDAIDAYATDRLDEGASPATVNRELAALLRMFNLGRRAKMVGRVPVIEKFEEHNVRTGFVEDGTFAAIEAELPDYAKPIAAVGFITGWRSGELLSRRWHHVDLQAGWLRLEPGQSKNDQGRQFPTIPRLREVLERQHERKLEVERATERIVTALFFHDTGEPVKDFRGAWKGACKRAGHPDLLFHDLRRSAVRNLVRAGIPQLVAMQLTGHLTASVFKRYAIIDESMLAEAAEKLTDLYTRTTPERKVVPMSPVGL